MKISVVLLAGGKGSRMQTPIPKQFLTLCNKTIAHYSFDLFCQMPEIDTISVVCEEKYHSFFQHNKSSHARIIFASPGERRQDSVFNGFNSLSLKNDELICVHDAARPFINALILRPMFKAAEEYGAAVLGTPIKFTVKESNEQGFVQKTLPRAMIWEIQTPQTIKAHLLHKGFAFANDKNITVTDDVSLVELLDHPVKIVEGSSCNLKITTIDDLPVAEQILTTGLFDVKSTKSI
jgi:2-C-methyl-D-erythritol 4-phosphate cytidylyltransferase